VHLPSRNEVKVAFSDHSKAETIFKPRKKMPLTDGIRAMAEWARTYGAREGIIFDNIEVAKNMPESWVDKVPGGPTQSHSKNAGKLG